jgi:HlyD family secretion protein
MNARRWFKSAVVLLLAAALAYAVFEWTREEPVRVAVHEVARGTVQTTVANTRAGTVEACRRAQIAPASGGQVAALNVREGDRVKAGQILMTLWNHDVAAQLDLAEAELRAAEARAEDACLRAVDAEREAQRVERLHRQGLSSDDTRDRATTEARARAAACRAAQANLGVSDANIALRRAAVDKTILTAPFDGIVAEVNPEVGEYVTPSPPGIPTPPAVDLIDDTCVYVSAPIDEVDAAAIRPGQAAMITLDAIRDRRFPGRVRRVAPYVVDIQKQARTVDVEVEFDAAGELPTLLTGYSADVEVVLAERSKVVRVPTEAVLEGSRVLLYVDGVLQERRFTPGISNWRYTEVLKGLQEGELLVTSLDRDGVAAGATAAVDSAKP